MSMDNGEQMSIEQSIMAAMDSAEDVPTQAETGTDTPTESESQQAPETTEPEPEQSEPATSGDGEPESQEAEPAPDMAPPEHWSSEEKEQFLAIPAEHREMVANTRKSLEKGYQTKFDDLASLRKEHEQIVNLVQPFEAQMQANGLDRVGGIRAMVGMQQMLLQNPNQAIAQLVQQYGGVNAAAIVQGIAQTYGVVQSPTASEADEYTDPQVQQLQSQMAQMQASAAQQQQFAQQQNQADASAQIQVFSGTKDDQGNLKFPHFDTVRAAMGDLITTGHAGGMEEAYEKAVWQNPDTRAILQADQQKSFVSNQDANRKESVKKAKASSRDVPTRRAAPMVNGTKSESILDSVAAAFDAQAG